MPLPLSRGIPTSIRIPRYSFIPAQLKALTLRTLVPATMRTAAAFTSRSPRMAEGDHGCFGHEKVVGYAKSD